LALVVLSVVEQRLDAVRAVLDGAEVAEIAARVGVHRATLHRWVARYLTGQLAGLADRSHRPRSSPRQVTDVVEAAVAEMRREHRRWGSRRIRLEMLRKPGPWARQGLVVPSERTINRILHRQGLLRARPRKRPRDSYVRFERPGPMQLWQMDIVGGLRLVSPVTGELREAKVVTAVDDHSRYCVIAKVAERATSRAVCLALAEALARFGVPAPRPEPERPAVHVRSMVRRVAVGQAAPGNPGQHTAWVRMADPSAHPARPWRHPAGQAHAYRHPASGGAEGGIWTVAAVRAADACADP
jgi:transposase